MKKEKEGVMAARRRVDVARGKIQSIAGSSKATRVFSSAKFPVCEGRGVHTSVFGEDSISRIQHTLAVGDADVVKQRLLGSPCEAGAGIVSE